MRCKAHGLRNDSSKGCWNLNGCLDHEFQGFFGGNFVAVSNRDSSSP